MTQPLSLIVRTSLAALAIGSVASAAEAGVFRASGGVRVGGGFSARVHAGWRPIVRPRAWVGYRPSYYYYPTYQPVPAYYPTVDVVAAPGVTQVIVAEPPLPRVGFGLFAGGLVTTNDPSGSSDIQGHDFGLLGRLRLTTGLVLEGELGKTTSFSSVSVDGVDYNRVERRLGASLLYEFGAHNRWAPYIVGGFGAQETDVGGLTSQGGYGEFGGGIRFAVSKRFHLTAELRAGARDIQSSSDGVPVPAVAERTIYPSPTPTSEPETETYVRSRLAAILWF